MREIRGLIAFGGTLIVALIITGLLLNGAAWLVTRL